MKNLIKLILLPVSVVCLLASYIAAAVLIVLIWIYTDGQGLVLQFKSAVFDWRDILPFCR